MNDIDLPATTTFLTVISPFIVAFIRRCAWSGDVVAFLSIIVIAFCYTIGQFLDGILIWPLSQSFWGGLMAAWAANQFLYKFFLKGTKSIKALEQVGDKPNAV